MVSWGFWAGKLYRSGPLQLVWKSRQRCTQLISICATLLSYNHCSSQCHAKTYMLG